MKVVGSLLFWGFLVVSSLVAFPIALLIWALTVPFDRRLRALHAFTSFWGSLYTWFNPWWRVHIDGRQNIRPNTAYVLVSNHQSLVDILVLFRLFRHYKWVSKVENFRVPVIGWNMSLNRYIRLVRGNRESVVTMLRACRKALAEGSSIMMFPEGTRSVDGRIREFKPGAFELAKDCQAPIVPIVLDGTSRALPKRGFVLQGRHTITVRVLPEIPPQSFADTPVAELAQQVRALIGAELERSQQQQAA